MNDRNVTSVDPVTFEVLNHRLLSITEEMGIQYMRCSGSNVLIPGNDAATAIMLPDGALVSVGPYIVTQGNVLPLRRDAVKKIAVIGPMAAQNPLGDYSGIPTRNVSLLDGLREKLGTGAEVVYAPGVMLTKNGDALSYNNVQNIARPVFLMTACPAWLCSSMISISLTLNSPMTTTMNWMPSAR